MRSILFCLLFLFPLMASANPRVLSVNVYDEGTLSSEGFSPQVDSIQDDCEPDEDTIDLEDFFDTLLGINVINTLNKDITFKRFNYRLRYSDSGTKRRARVKRQGITGNFIAPGYDKETEVLVLFLDMNDGRKHVPNSSTPLPEEGGFSTLRVRLSGTTSDGQRVRLRAKVTISIGNYDRC